MSTAPAFTAQLIRSSTRGFSRIVTAKLFEDLGSAAEVQERYGSDGFELWSESLKDRLESLASSLESGDPTIFGNDVRWFRDVSLTRGVPASDIKHAIDTLAEVLDSSLPQDVSPTLAMYMDAARAALASDTDSTGGLAPNSAAAQLFGHAQVGDVASATELLLREVGPAGGQTAVTLQNVLLPAAVEAGRRWHGGQLGVAAEHVITATLRRALVGLGARLEPALPNGKAAFLAAVPGDAHDTALLALTVALENDGWRVAFAGADTPTDEIDATAAAFDCDLIALSVTLPAHRHPLTGFLAAREGGPPVLVGGAALLGEDDARRLGADGYAADLVSAIAEARRLVDLPA